MPPSPGRPQASLCPNPLSKDDSALSATSSLGIQTYVGSKSLARFCCEFLNLQHLAESAFSKSDHPNEAQTRHVLPFSLNAFRPSPHSRGRLQDVGVKLWYYHRTNEYGKRERDLNLTFPAMRQRNGDRPRAPIRPACRSYAWSSGRLSTRPSPTEGRPRRSGQVALGNPRLATEDWAIQIPVFFLFFTGVKPDAAPAFRR